MSLESIIIVSVLVLGFGSVLWLISRQKKTDQVHDIEELVNKAFGMSVTQVAEYNKHILASEKETIKNDLEHKQQVIEKLVAQVHQALENRGEQLQKSEKDRSRQFAELQTAIQHQRELTTQLSVTTKELAEMLSNNQQRGGWGERIIEDLLQSNGLVEGVHYRRQSQLGSSSLRPDITLLLPNQRVVPVDVKFPLREIQKMAAASTQVSKDQHIKQFGQDLKKKITKVALYIDPEHDTLDYAIMFVPNEMVFSFINQKFPDLVDEAFSQRVLIVSPFTFLIVARTVMESYRNFMIGDKLKEVVKHVNEFVTEWDRFKSVFEKYGRSIDTLRSDYEQLTGTRFRQMDKKVSQVHQYQHLELDEGEPA